MNAQHIDIKGLRTFSTAKDRELSPFFAGRREELALLDSRLSEMWREWQERGRAPSHTMVATGCPGMGKTSLLERFAQTRCDGRDADKPLAVWMDMGDLTSPKALADAVIDADRGFRSPARRVADTGVDLAAQLLRRAEAGETLRDAYRSLFDGDRAVVLLVDEAQHVSKRNRGMLRKLHQGLAGLPVLPVFAGLNDACDRIQDQTSTRLATGARIQLDRLAQEDSREAVERMIERYGLPADTKPGERWIDAIVDDALGFPQHLHAGMAAAAGVLAANGGMLDDRSLADARLRAAQERERYYQGRISPDIMARAHAVVYVVRAVETRRLVLRGDIEKIALEGMRAHPTSKSPSGKEARDLVGRLIRRGVLQQDGVLDGYRVPIPSMSTWILRDFAQAIGFEVEDANARGKK